MENEKYSALLCAIDEGSLTAAADKLGYTTSGISRMIAALERDTGFALLTRDRSGVNPTAECEKLLPHIRNIVREEDTYIQIANEIRGLHTGTITIGTSIEAYFPLLSSLVASFSEIYPDIHVDITEDLSSHLVNDIENGKADFCIISQRNGDFRWIPVTEDSIVALVPKESKYANLDALPIDTFIREPFIDIYHSDETDNSIMFKRNGIKPKTLYSCTNCFAAAAMIEAGLGMTTENNLIATRWTSSVKILPLDPPQPLQIGIAVPQEKNTSPAAKKFLSFAETHLDRFRL